MILDANKDSLVTCSAAKIYFDGVLQCGTVVCCNDETGEAVVYSRTINGGFAYIGFGNHKKLITKLVKTTITIEIPAGVPGGPYTTPQKED